MVNVIVRFPGNSYLPRKDFNMQLDPNTNFRDIRYRLASDPFFKGSSCCDDYNFFLALEQDFLRLYDDSTTIGYLKSYENKEPLIINMVAPYNDADRIYGPIERFSDYQWDWIEWIVIICLIIAVIYLFYKKYEHNNSE